MAAKKKSKQSGLEALLQRARKRLKAKKTHSTDIDVDTDVDLSTLIANLEQALAVESAAANARADTLGALALAQTADNNAYTAFVYAHNATLTAAMELVIALI